MVASNQRLVVFFFFLMIRAEVVKGVVYSYLGLTLFVILIWYEILKKKKKFKIL